MTPVPTAIRRRTVLVNPRLQLGTALALAAVLLAGGILFGVALHRVGRDALWTASFRGHFPLRTPYELLGGLVVRRLAALFGLVTVAGGAVLLLMLRRIDAGLARVAESFRASAAGDLSTPTNAPGPRGIADLGVQLDVVREQVLGLIGDLRREADLLRKEPLPEDEFLRRWKGLKERIGRIAP